MRRGAAPPARIQYGDGLPHPFTAGNQAQTALRRAAPHEELSAPAALWAALHAGMAARGGAVWRWWACSTLFACCCCSPSSIMVLNPRRTRRPDLSRSLQQPRWHFDLHADGSGICCTIHNAWDVVAFALVVSTLLKGLCDYLGTYLVNYAGFGTITDLRNHLYETTCAARRSFFHQHPTGTILSTLINDVDRVQTALSSVLGDFLQQFFTFLVDDHARDYPGRTTELGAAAVHPGGHHVFAAASAAKCAPAPAPGRTSWPRFRTFCTRP